MWASPAPAFLSKRQTSTRLTGPTRKFVRRFRKFTHPERVIEASHPIEQDTLATRRLSQLAEQCSFITTDRARLASRRRSVCQSTGFGSRKHPERAANDFVSADLQDEPVISRGHRLPNVV